MRAALFALSFFSAQNLWAGGDLLVPPGEYGCTTQYNHCTGPEECKKFLDDGCQQTGYQVINNCMNLIVCKEGEGTTQNLDNIAKPKDESKQKHDKPTGDEQSREPTTQALPKNGNGRDGTKSKTEESAVVYLKNAAKLTGLAMVACAQGVARVDSAPAESGVLLDSCDDYAAAAVSMKEAEAKARGDLGQVVFPGVLADDPGTGDEALASIEKNFGVTKSAFLNGIGGGGSKGIPKLLGDNKFSQKMDAARLAGKELTAEERRQLLADSQLAFLPDLPVLRAVAVRLRILIRVFLRRWQFLRR